MNGLQDITLDKIVPFTWARNNLSALAKKVRKEDYFVITKRLQPSLMVLDPNYFAKLQELERRAQIFEKLKKATAPFTPIFSRFLKDSGYNAQKINDNDVLEIIDKI